MWLVIGDLHQTEHARDAYRFGIFKWIRKQQEKFKPAATFLLGDLTDSKDRHSATLVNKIVSGLVSLKPPVYILQGNHDYKADQANPFFKFLSHIDGIEFITEPTTTTAIRPVAMIPHYRSQNEFDQAVKLCCEFIDPSGAFLCHQTFDGAIAESGVRLSGLSASLIESFDPALGIYAGDVHRPQTQGLITYVGCPYQVRFGDDFEPRSIYVAKSGTESYPWFPAPQKWSLTVRGPEDLLNKDNLYEGDQVKLTIEVSREEAVEWDKIKQEVLAACKKLKLEVYGAKMEIAAGKRRQRVEVKHETDPKGIVEQFCTSEKLSSQIRKAGLRLLGEK